MNTVDKKIIRIKKPYMAAALAAVHTGSIRDFKGKDEVVTPYTPEGILLDVPGVVEVAELDLHCSAIDMIRFMMYYNLLKSNSDETRIHGINNKNGDLIAFTHYTLGGKEAELNGVYVDSPYQGGHIGSLLVRNSIFHLIEHDEITLVNTSVVASEHQLGFFGNLGFVNKDGSHISPEQANYELTPLKYLVKSIN